MVFGLFHVKLGKITLIYVILHEKVQKPFRVTPQYINTYTVEIPNFRRIRIESNYPFRICIESETNRKICRIVHE